MYFDELLEKLKPSEIKTSAMLLLVWLAHFWYRLAYTHFCFSLRLWQQLESFRAKHSVKYR